MSALPTPELSRRIKLAGLPGETVVVEADAGERAALAARFSLPGIDSLRAEVELEQRGSAVRATGTLKAAIRQTCAISGEDFPANIDEALDLRFVEAGSLDTPIDENEEIEVELGAEDCDEIEYSGDAFDLGEAVAQSLGLAIDPYAEGPEADAAREKAGIVKEGEQEGPLAEMLKGLKRD
ncbi:YceD family protein [uncultured Erythrobacter sp.]|uniref:YceD family protein n=1 Tax=uncultured Erythrobacter sp. TaxID=263913 RepID=UPI00262EF45C|nr:YceD family protein [uncultured Erythrobacter sp.]